MRTVSELTNIATDAPAHDVSGERVMYHYMSDEHDVSATVIIVSLQPLIVVRVVDTVGLHLLFQI